jgi:hypothetical protein
MKKLYFFIGCLFAFSACIKPDEFNIKKIKTDDWNPDFAFPIVDAKITLDDALSHLPGTFIEQDASKFITLKFETGPISYNIGNYLVLPSQTLTIPNFPLSLPLNLPSFTATVTDGYSGNFNFGGSNNEQIKHLNLKAGSLDASFNSTYQHDITATLTFVNMVKNNVPLAINVNLTQANNSFQTNFNLKDYKIDLSNNNTTANQLLYSIAYTITGTGAPITSTDGISASFNFSGLKFSYIDGNLGSITIPLTADSIGIPIFDNNVNASIFLEDPKVFLDIKSSIGIGAELSLDSIYGILKSGSSNNIGGLFNATPIQINQPTVVGQSAITNIKINKTNSNIQNVFNPAPVYIYYKGKIELNPPTLPGSNNNFVTDTSEITVTGSAEIPAWFKITDLRIEDTFKLNLPKDTSLIEQVVFKIKMENGFGMYSAMQLYFIDKNNVAIDSLLPANQQLLAEASVNAVGKVVKSGQSELEIVIPIERYKKIRRSSTRCILQGKLLTSGSNSVRIYATDYLRMQLALRAKFNVSLNF